MLACLPLSAVAAPPKRPPAVKVGKKPPPKRRAAPQGRLLRTLNTRVTAFYSFKDKKKGRIHPMAAVSEALTVKVVKRAKSKPTKRK